MPASRCWPGCARVGDPVGFSLFLAGGRSFSIANTPINDNAAHEMPIIDNKVFSKKVRRMLGLSLHGWENTMVASLAFAALFSVIVGVSTYCVVQLQREEITSSKEEFERYKLEAGEKISTANASGEAAKAEATNAIAETARANERTAELRLALDREIAARQPRTITVEQHDAIVAMLKPERIYKGRVLINSTFDGEAWQFAEKISNVLKEAGFETQDVPMGERLLGINRSGVFIWIRDIANQPRHAGPIFKAFSQVGVPMIGAPEPSVPDNETVVIAVASHP
jgi:hypothetical protein